MVIKEFGAVVTVETQEWECKVRFDVFDLFDDSSGTVVPCGLTLGPSSVDIGKSKAPDETAFECITAVSYCVSFNEAGLRNIPVTGTDRYLVPK